MPSVRTLLFGAGAALLGLALGPKAIAQGKQPASAAPTFRITSNLVFLDVTVVDKKDHRPVVTGLTKDDFTITENGKLQRIFSFDAPDAGAKTVGEAPATILVLDLVNTPTKDSAFARYSLNRYLAMQPKRLSSPTELMVLNNTSLDMVQAYTHSREDLMYALNHVPPAEPYKLTGGKDWLDQRLSQSIQALQQIALQNRGLRGRKNILWVGYGGPGIPIDPADPKYEKSMRIFAHGTTNMLVDARISLFVINPGGVQGTQNPNYWRIDSSPPVLGATVDIPGDPFAGSINFGMLVRGTGGVFFHNRNDVDAEIGEAQELGSNYYTLTYQPPMGTDDGKYRKIEVALRDPNLRAMTKTGYYSPEPATKSVPTPQRVDPMVEISEAAQSNVTFDSLGLTVAHVTRQPDRSTAELTVLLKSTHLRWQAADDGRSAANITVGAVSLSKRRDILASRLQELTIFSNSQDPARLAKSNTLVTVTVPVPRHTDRVRVLIRAQDGGRIGTVDLDHKTLAVAPANPSPEPKLQERPRAVGITRQP
jgi:VWFA-related protein